MESTHRRKWELVAAAGWDVLLLVPRRWPEAGRWQHGTAGRFGRLRVEPLGGLFAGRVARWTPVGLAARLEGFQPDLVHAEEEPYGAACLLAARAARQRRVPFTFFTWENIARTYRWPQQGLIRAALAAAAGAIAGNVDGLRILRGRGFRRPADVIPQYGVDGRVFRPLPRARCRRALGLPAGGALVGFVGRFLREKGIDDLLLAARGLGGAVRVLLVGSGPDLPRLVARARVLGMADRLDVRPALPRPRVPLALGALDVLVLPSRTRPDWKEQFGRVVPEAHACGRWAVGSSSGEIPRVLGAARFAYPEGDAAGLARRLRALLRRRPPAALRRRALARFSDEAVAAATARFLHARLDAGSGRLVRLGR